MFDIFRMNGSRTNPSSVNGHGTYGHPASELQGLGDIYLPTDGRGWRVMLRRPTFCTQDREYVEGFIANEIGHIGFKFRASCVVIGRDVCSQLLYMSSKPHYLFPKEIKLHHLADSKDFIFGSLLTDEMLSTGPFTFYPFKVIGRNGEPPVMHAGRLLELAMLDLYFYFPFNSALGRQVAMDGYSIGHSILDWLIFYTFPSLYHDSWNRLFCSITHACTRADWFLVSLSAILCLFLFIFFK